MHLTTVPRTVGLEPFPPFGAPVQPEDPAPTGVRVLEDRRRLPPLNGRLYLGLLLLIAALLRFLACFGYLLADERMILDNIVTFIKDRTILPAHYQYPPFFSYVGTLPTVLWCVLLKLVGLYDSPYEVMALRYLDSIVPLLPLRFLSASLGVGTILIVVRTGKRFFRPGVGLLAAGLLTFSYLHVERSALATSDIATGFLAACALHFLLRVSQTNGTRHWLLAGLFVGLAAATKYNAALLISGVLAVHVVLLRSNGELASVRAWFGRNVWLCGLAILLSFALASPSCFLELKRTLAGIQREALYRQQGFLGAYDQPYIGWWHRLWERETLLGVLFLCGVAHSLLRRRKEDWILVAVVLPAVAVISGWRHGGLHYFLFIYPALSLMASDMLLGWPPRKPSAKGVSDAERSASEMPPRHPPAPFSSCTGGLKAHDHLPRWRTGRIGPKLLPLAIGGALVWPAWRTVGYAWKCVGVQDSRSVAQEWIYKNIPEGATIACDPIDLPRLQAEGHSGLLEGPRAEFFRKRLEGVRRYRFLPMPYESGNPRTVEADYLLLSSPWYERFERRPPPLTNPHYHRHIAASRFYAGVLSSPTQVGWELLRVFDTGSGPCIRVYRRLRSSAHPPKPSMASVPGSGTVDRW